MLVGLVLEVVGMLWFPLVAWAVVEDGFSVVFVGGVLRSGAFVDGVVVVVCVVGVVVFVSFEMLSKSAWVGFLVVVHMPKMALESRFGKGMFMLYVAFILSVRRSPNWPEPRIAAT